MLEAPPVPSHNKVENKILDQPGAARPSGDVMSTSLTAAKTEDVAVVNSGSSAPMYVLITPHCTITFSLYTELCKCYYGCDKFMYDS